MVNFKYKEVIKSETARRLNIDNNVPNELFDNMMNSTVGIQRVRDLLKIPMRINSWYRSPELNNKVGGAIKSAHLKCLAVDFVPIRMNINEAYELISKSDIQFDQLILERNSAGSVWIHISWSNKNRRQIFKLEKREK